MKFKKLMRMLPGLLLYVGMASGQENYGITKIGQLFDSWSGIRDLVVENDIAYVATSGTGLKILDISDPRAMREIGSLCNLFGVGGGGTISKVGNFIYVGGFEEFYLPVIDVSDPTSPIISSRIRVGRPDHDTVVRDTLLFFNYLDPWGRGFQIMNIANPDHPVALGDYYFGDPNDFVISGNYAYFADDYNGLVILDIADLSEPVLAASLDFDDIRPTGIDKSGDLVCMAFGESGLNVIDVTDPCDPVVIGYLDERVSGIEMVEARAFIVLPEGIGVVDLDNPAFPEVIGILEGENFGTPIVYNQNRLFVENENERLSIIDVDDPEHLSEAGRFEGIEVYLNNISVDNGFAYMLGSGDGDELGVNFRGLFVVDISDPHNPTLTGTLNDRSLFDLARRGPVPYLNYLYIPGADSTGLHIIDVDDPWHPREIARFFEGSGFGKLILDDDRGYLSMYSGGYEILDFSDPLNPLVLDTIVMPENRSEIEFVTGNLAIGHADNLIALWDIGDPRNPHLLSTLDLYNNFSIAVHGDKLYAIYENRSGEHAQYLAVYDISDPRQPVSLGLYTPGRNQPDFGYRQMIADENHVYTMGWYEGLWVFDVSDPANIRMTGKIATPGSCRSMTIQSNYVYLADTYSMGIYDCSEALDVATPQIVKPIVFVLNPVYPNPFNNKTIISVDLDQPGMVDLGVFDLVGRRIETVFADHLDAGKHKLIWNAETTPAGIYFMKMQGPNGVRTSRLALVK